MSKVINLEVIDIVDGFVVLETETGYEIEIDTESLPENLKIGQSIKCVMSLNPSVGIRPDITREKQKLPNGRHLSY